MDRFVENWNDVPGAHCAQPILIDISLSFSVINISNPRYTSSMLAMENS